MSGNETTSAPKAGLLFAISETAPISNPDTAALMTRYDIVTPPSAGPGRSLRVDRFHFLAFFRAQSAVISSFQVKASRCGRIALSDERSSTGPIARTCRIPWPVWIWYATRNTQTRRTAEDSKLAWSRLC
jgi:hypothetical protein